MAHFLKFKILESMKTLHFPNTTFKYKYNTNAFEKTNTALKNKKVDWLFKRIILHIIWGILNIVGLVYISTLISGTGWELVFLIGGLIYCLSYWIITCIIFDKLIGDEIDNIK